MLTKIKEINILNDVMFKSVMTNKNNREMVVDVIHELTGIEKDLLFKATYIGGEEIPKKNLKEKRQITDVTIRISNKHQIIIEMNQFLIKNVFEKNSLYGFSRILEATNKNMMIYPKIILINIDNFNKFKTNKKLLEFKIRDEEGNIESEIYASIHLILENFKQKDYNKCQEIEKFAQFLKTETIEELKKMFKGEKKFMAAVRTVEELSSDPEFEGYYDYEEAKNQELEEAKAYAIEQGLEQGIEQGIEQGKNIANLEIARKMLACGKSYEEIKEFTGLSKQQLEEI